MMMRRNKKNRILLSYLLLIIWTSIWVVQFYKDIKQNYHDFKNLMGESQEQKWEYVFGHELYDFLQKAKYHIPEDGTFSVIHTLSSYLHQRAFTYYLYPRRVSEEGRYQLIYKVPNVNKEGKKILYLNNERTTEEIGIFEKESY